VCVVVACVVVVCVVVVCVVVGIKAQVRR